MPSSPVAADRSANRTPLSASLGSPIASTFWNSAVIQDWVDRLEPTDGEDNENNEENGNDEDNDKSTSSTSYTVPSLCPCGLGFLSPVLLRRGAVLSPIYLVLQKRHFQFHPCESAPAAYAILQPPENPGIPLFYTTSLPEAMEAFDGIISDYRDSDVIGAVTGEGADRVFEVTEGNEKLEGFEGLWYRSYWIVKVEHVTGDGPPVN